MMNATFIGCGAAGNKVAIELIENDIMPRNKVHLLNSTDKDMPEFYRDKAIIFAKNTIGGCGKERNRGKQLLLEAMQREDIDPDNLIDPNDQLLILCGSVEGGSGSASISILTEYYKEQLGINVATILIFGFEDDTRGLQNSIEICQELITDCNLITVSNKKFMDEAHGNRIKAEKLANNEIINRINVLLGGNITYGDQNIDEMDLYKTATMVGYSDIGLIELPKIKNMSQYNTVINEAIDNTKSLDIDEPSAKRLGVIFTINEKSEGFIDFSSEVFKDRFGTPYEYFYHIQYTEGQETVSYVASGMKVPFDDINNIYQKYLEQSNKVNKTNDGFKALNSFKGNSEDSMFNVNRETRIKKPTDKSDFFKKYETKPDDSKFKKTVRNEPEEV